MVKLKQNLKSETLKKKTSSRTMPYASAWNLIIKHIGVMRRRRLCLKLEQQNLDQASKIGDWSDWIRACDFDWERELSVCNADRIRACDTSRYFTLYFSLFFSLSLWVLLWSVVWIVVWDWERESSLSFWTDSLSLSLIYFTLFVGVSLCWSVCLFCSVLWFVN